MRKQTLIRVIGILVLLLATAFALAERPSRMPSNHAGSRGMDRKPGILSQSHLSSPNSRNSRPSPDMKSGRSSLRIPTMNPESRKPQDTRFKSPVKIEKSFQFSRENKESFKRDWNRDRPESHQRPFDRNDRRDDRDRDHRPPRVEYYHRYPQNHYASRYYRPDYRNYWYGYYRKPNWGFSVSLGSDWKWISYDPFYSNYFDSGLSWDFSYGSDDYQIYVSSGNTTYVTSYQVWVPGHWETVYNRVTDIGPGGVICWRYKSSDVWKPGYWKVCYR
jgi:hypothetical protein